MTFAFEHQCGDEPQELWRVFCFSGRGRHKMRQCSYYTTREDAERKAVTLKELKATGIKVQRYVLTP